VFIDETWAKTNMDPPPRARCPRRPAGRQGAAGPLAHADFSGSAAHDRITAPCVIDGPINGTSMILLG
jgi:hypothetical protein